MRRKSILILQLVAVVLQVLALVITIGMTAVQSVVKSVFVDYSAVLDIFSIPLQSLLRIIPMLLIYFVGLMETGKSATENRKGIVVFMIGLAIFFQIVLQYGNLINYFIARQGEVALLSYSALESAVSMITNPLICLAFALFCFACGGCFGTPSETE